MHQAWDSGNGGLEIHALPYKTCYVYDASVLGMISVSTKYCFFFEVGNSGQNLQIHFLWIRAIAFVVLVVMCIFLVTYAYFYLGRAWVTNSEKWWGECQTAALSKTTQQIRTGNWWQRKKAGSAHQVDRGKTFVKSSIRFSDDNNIDGVKMWKWHRSVTRCY